MKIHNRNLNDISKGINKFVDVVGNTLGSNGNTVIIDSEFSEPIATKDGITVANYITGENDLENLAIKVLRTITSKTSEECGDGTTTSTVLAGAIFNEGKNFFNSKTFNVNLLKDGMDYAVTKVNELLTTSAKIIDNKDSLKDIATISANNDHFIGGLIADAFEFVGKDGLVKIEDSPTSETYLKVVKGMEFDKGFVSNYFTNDEQNKECVFDNPYIVVTDYKINNVNSFSALLNQAIKEQRGVLMIVDDLEFDALNILLMNKIKNGLKVCAVKCPSYGDNRKNMLEDIAILVGAKYVSQERGDSLDLDFEHIGTCKKVIITKDKTQIISDEKPNEKLTSRIELLKNEYQESKDIKVKERLAKLENGIGVLYVGGDTEIEMKEKKDRFDDALRATQSALEKGIVVGGGVAFLRCALKLEQELFEGDFNNGVKIIRNSLYAPIKKLLENANLDANKIINLITTNTSWNFGYDTKNNKYGDLFELGVVDPLKTLQSALKNSLSVVKLLLNTHYFITNEPKEKDNYKDNYK